MLPSLILRELVEGWGAPVDLHVDVTVAARVF
jgi:hypothetical protein